MQCLIKFYCCAIRHFVLSSFMVDFHMFCFSFRHSLLTVLALCIKTCLTDVVQVYYWNNCPTIVSKGFVVRSSKTYNFITVCFTNKISLADSYRGGEKKTRSNLTLVVFIDISAQFSLDLTKVLRQVLGLHFWPTVSSSLTPLFSGDLERQSAPYKVQNNRKDIKEVQRSLK